MTKQSRSVALAFVMLFASHEAATHAAGVPAGSAFSYQGVLRSNNAPVNGSVDLQFALFDASSVGNQIGSTFPASAVSVVDGVFTASLDFGALAFNGEARWLEIAVRSPAGSANPFITLSPRQKIESTPYATYALNVAIAGAYGSEVNFSNAANTFAGTFTGNGAALTNLNASALAGLIPSASIGGTYGNALTLSNASNSFAGTFTGTHSGNGSGLTSLNASNIANGTIANARTTGTAANTPNTLVLRDGSGNFSAGTITGAHAGSGAALTSLNASNIASGTLSESRLPSSVLDRIPALTGSATLASSLGLPGIGNSVVASNGFIYFNTLLPAEFHVFDVSNPSSPAHRASVPAVSGNDLVVVGNFAYLVGNGSLGIQIFDISNPDSPALAGSFPTSSSPIGIDVVGSLAYVVSFDLDVLEIFNISNPASVTLVGSLLIAGEPVSVRVSGSHAYVALNDGDAVQVVNVSNPASPSLTGSVPIGQGPRMLTLAGNLAYVVCNHDDLLQIVDISNPNSPALVGSVPTDEGPSDVRVAGGLAYITNFSGDSIQLFDISNAASPSLLQTIDTIINPRRVSVLNGFAYVTTVDSKGLLTFAPDSVSFAGGSPITGSGLGLTSLNASSIATGVIANTFTSGTSSNTSDTLVLRDALGAFNAGAARLNFGTAASPSITFTNDPDTGMFRPTVDTLAFATGGTERLRISASGFVGIGTSAPTRALHVVGTAAITGDVGIGTTAPSASLHVQDGSAGSIAPSANSSLVLERSGNNVVHLYTPDVSESGILFGGDTTDVRGGILFNSTVPEGLAFRTGGNTSRMVISSAGDVGIGATAPLANLHVRGPADLGSLLIAPASSNANSQIFLAEQNSMSFGMIMRYDGAANLLHVIAQQSGVETAPLFTIERSTTGRIGMGRTPASNKLEVEGNASKTTSGSWLANSDARIKSDIEPVADALETLDRVRLTSFRYTPEYLKAHSTIEDRRYLNVIAQEFAQVFPEHVKGSGEYLPSGEEILQVDIHPLTIYSAAAIQELHADSQRKDSEISSLREDNRLLRAEMEELRMLVQRLLQQEQGR